MSTTFPKSKEKRPRSPGEPNSSFIKNVTSRVSGLLPSTIAKWFSSPSSNTNGSVRVADATDSSTEDEAPESPSIIQPPSKKIRYASPAEYNYRIPVETRCTGTNTELIDEVYTVNSPIGKSNAQRDNIFASTRVHSTIDDTTVETIQDKVFKPQHSVSVIEKATSKKRKSLFGSAQDEFYKKNSESKSGNIRDPNYKPSLLSSPFYVGRTMYGGATSSYLTPTSFKKKTISVTNETNDNDSVNMSHSARRVMDLLEHYSSPLIEAKRLPPIIRDPKIPNFHNSLHRSVNHYGSKVYSYKTQELYVPSVASILSIKRRSRLMDTTSAARQLIASHSSSSDFLSYPEPYYEGDVSDEVSRDKFTTKIQSRLTRTGRDRNIELEDNISETVTLPNVILQIDKDNLPKFTFGPISTPEPPQSSSIQTPVIISPEAFKKSTEYDKVDHSGLKYIEQDHPFQKKNNFDYYTFSRPVQISNESNTASVLSKFSFGTPESNLERVHEDKTEDDFLPLNTSNQTIFDDKLTAENCSDWKCLDCGLMNKIDVNKCEHCSDKQPIEIDDSKTCSVCNITTNHTQGDKCTECEKKTNSIEKTFVNKDADTSKWTCDVCWINNNESADICVCCGAKNPKKVTPAAVTKSEKIAESEWKCDDCWIKNNNVLLKCAACGGAKPGSKAITSNSCGINAFPKVNQGDNKVKETLDTTFKNIVKGQSERWECPLCLVRNESNNNTCVCCDANKPGTEKETNIKFNFHQPSEITFKFGIQPNQETCTNIEPEECNMAEDSETNNNILPKTPTFNFGLLVKKFECNTDSINNNAAEAPKMNFKFGIQKDQTSTVRENFFNIPSKLFETNKVIEEKPQEVPQMFVPPVASDFTKQIGLFKSSQVAPEIPTLLPLQQMNQNIAINKDTPFSSIPNIPSTCSETKKQENNFTFPSIMPATNLFAAPPKTTTAMSNILPATHSTSVPASSSSISIFTNADVVTTTSSSFFQNSNIPTLGMSLFPKAEPTTSTTPSTSVPMSSMQPLFSFGGKGTTLQAEKPLFSFNFTNNKTDSSTIFKPPSFGVSAESIVESNNFNLQSNSVIGANALAGSQTQMNTVNPLTTGNSLTTPPGSGIFGATVPKDNMWPPSSNNIFSTNTTTNGDQKPPAFTFGTQFSGNNAPFGSTTQQSQPNNAPFGSTAQQTQSNNAPFGSNIQQSQPSNAPFGSTGQQTQPTNAPFGSTAQQTQPNNALFGSSAQQTQQNNAPFGSSAQQTQLNNAPFGSNLQQTQSNSVPFGNTTQQVQPNSVPFGSAQPGQQTTTPFGSIQQTQPNNVPFGSTTQQTPPNQPPHMFGIASPTTSSQPSIFGNPMQQTPNLFGGLQVPNNPMAMGMFGTPNPIVTPSFGAMSPPIPTFETSTPAQPAPTASFNFGGHQQSPGIFGFGQQQPPGQMPQMTDNQPGMYAFGAPSGAVPRMKFNIGTAPNTAVRRVRKAMRRSQR